MDIKIGNYAFINERIARFIVERGHRTFFLHMRHKKAKGQFYDDQQDINRVVKTDYVVICGDLNAQISEIPIPGMLETFGEHALKRNGVELQQFATINKQKYLIHRVIFSRTFL